MLFHLQGSALRPILRKHQRYIFLFLAINLILSVFELHRLRPDRLGSYQFDSTPGVGRDSNLLKETASLIPRNIWQIFLAPRQSDRNFKIDPQQLVDTPSWLVLNPEYQYTLVEQDSADRFVDDHYAEDERILRTWRALSNPGLKSDFLRYLLLYTYGGVYTDTDTVALKPIGDWVPEALRDVVKVVVGIEYDRLDGGPWAEIPHDLQFCQWTIAAAPGHPLFTKMTERALTSLDELARSHNTTLERLEPSSFEVMNSTGPAAWTDVVYEQLQQADTELTSLRDLSGLTAPALHGDILILTVDGFGMGQVHSHSTNDGSVPEAALMKHNFRGSWRGG